MLLAFAAGLVSHDGRGAEEFGGRPIDGRSRALSRPECASSFSSSFASTPQAAEAVLYGTVSCTTVSLILHLISYYLLTASIRQTNSSSIRQRSKFSNLLKYLIKEERPTTSTSTLA